MRNAGLLGIAAAIAMLASVEPIGGSHQVGPGQRKSPVRGTRADPDEEQFQFIKMKDKSKSLKRLLRR